MSQPKDDTYQHDLEAFIEDRPLNPDPEVDLSDARFVPLHTFGSPAEAEMVNDLLRQNNLRSAIQSSGNDAFAPLLSVTAPGAMVLIDERDLAQAQQIYQSYFGNDTTPLTGSSLEDDAPPNDESGALR